MLFFKKLHKRPQTIETLIGSKTSVLGDIRFSGGLRIDGAVKGDVREAEGMPSTLVLGENGTIEGNITVSRIVFNGKVTGNIHSVEYIELQPKAHIYGDVHYKAIEMDPGATIEGKLIHLVTQGNNILLPEEN